MPQMTKKGQKFVGREIGRMVRKGPSKGPQKGKKMPPKQAVAVALNVARKKGYKVPPRKGDEAVMYRDPEYGALAIIQEDGRFIVYDHNSIDAPAVLGILERTMRPEKREDGGVTWHPGRSAHPAIVEAEIRRVMQVKGYIEDTLGERAIVMVPRVEAVAPDLPSADRFHMVHEPLEAGLRRHVEVAVTALQEHGRVTPPTVMFHGRPHARDSFGRALPFLIARAFIETEDTAAVEDTLREALRPVDPYLVRATVLESSDGGPATVEVALAPSASICESYMDTSIPTFESHVLSGARTVWLSLDHPLGLAETADISELAAMSTGALGLRTERNGRAVVASIPSSHPGVYLGDHAFQERLGWLIRLLDPWNPEVKDIGEQQEMMAGAPGSRDGLTEADADIRAAQRAASTGDLRAAARLQRMLVRAGQDDLAPDDPPSGMDADALRDLQLHIDNTAKYYRWQRQLEKRYLQRMTGPGSLTKAGKPRTVSGSYRRDMAAKGYMNLLNDAARDYIRGAGGGSVRVTFPKRLREFLSMQLAKRFERRVRDGELEESVLASLDEATRKQVGDSVLGPETFNMNVATTSVSDAVRYAERLYSMADDANLEHDLPNLEQNFRLLKGKMRYALDIPRVQMPVIEPKDISTFAKRLAKGHIDIFAPWADLSSAYGPSVAARAPDVGGGQFPDWSQMRGGSKGRMWVTLGVLDGNKGDDKIQGRVGMVPVKDLKPLQNQIWYDKCIASILKFGVPEPGGFLLTNAVIIVSKEGYILDGHHRFGQAMLADPNLKIKALRIPLDIDTLLKVGRSYGSAIGNAPKESMDEGVRDVLMADLRRLNPERGPDTGLPGVVRLKQKPPVVASALKAAGWREVGAGASSGSRKFIKIEGGQKATTNLYARFGGSELSRGEMDLRVFPGQRRDVGQRVRDELQDLAGIMGKRFKWEAKDPIKRRGTGKTTKQANPKGSMVQVGEPEDPTKDLPDEMSVLRDKLKAAKEKYKEAGKANEGWEVPSRHPFRRRG